MNRYLDTIRGSGSSRDVRSSSSIEHYEINEKNERRGSDPELNSFNSFFSSTAIQPTEAVALVRHAFPEGRLRALEPRRHCSADHDLPAVEQTRSPDGAIGPSFRLAMERGAAVFGEWPLPQVKPSDYALPNRGKKSGSKFYRVLPEERVLCVNPAGGDGLPHELISRGALELLLTEIARNLQRAARLFAKQHQLPPSAERNTSDDIGENPAVRAELERIWPQAERLRWSWRQIFNREFWSAQRGLASVLDPGDRIVEVTADHLVIEKADAHHTRQRFWRMHDEQHFDQSPCSS